MITTRESLMVIPGQPWSKMRPKISQAVRGRRPRTHQDPADKAAEGATRKILQELWGNRGPELGNVKLSAWFYRKNRQVVDLDNLLKHLLDAATGVLWINDCQVTAFGDIQLFVDAEAPRTELTVCRHRTSMTRSYVDMVRPRDWLD